jgi:hypothetical protein
MVIIFVDEQASKWDEMGRNGLKMAFARSFDFRKGD